MSDTMGGKAADAVRRLDAHMKREESAYRHGEDRPLRPFMPTSPPTASWWASVRSLPAGRACRPVWG